MLRWCFLCGFGYRLCVEFLLQNSWQGKILAASSEFGQRWKQRLWGSPEELITEKLLWLNSNVMMPDRHMAHSITFQAKGAQISKIKAHFWMEMITKSTRIMSDFIKEEEGLRFKLKKLLKENKSIQSIYHCLLSLVYPSLSLLSLGEHVLPFRFEPAESTVDFVVDIYDGRSHPADSRNINFISHLSN